MKIVVNINKKYFFGILVAMFLLIGVLVAFAYDSSFKSNDVLPSVAGHSADEVNVKLSDGVMSLQQAIDSGKLCGGDGQTVSGFKHYIDVTDDKTLKEWDSYRTAVLTIPNPYGSPPSFLRATLVNICPNSHYYSTEINIEDDLVVYNSLKTTFVGLAGRVLANNTAISVNFYLRDTSNNFLLYSLYNSEDYFFEYDCWRIRVRAGWV